MRRLRVAVTEAGSGRALLAWRPGRRAAALGVTSAEPGSVADAVRSGQETFNRHESAQNRLRNCWNASCVNATLVDHAFAPAVDYVYVPYGGFMSGRSGTTISPALHESLVASDQFTRVYRNDGVAVYEYDQTAAAGSASQATDE